MPKSKRDKVVHLTKTAKKGKAIKEKVIKELQECLDTYETVYVFRAENMKNEKFKDIRLAWKGSRFFMGKNKVMLLALGKSSHKNPALYKFLKYITGQCGLLFTNSSKQEVVDYFNEYQESHFARAGFVATKEVKIPAGPLSQFPFSMETQLRKLGLPTQLKDGVIQLLANVTICQPGDELTPEQARLLELWGVEMAIFRVHLICHYNVKTKTFELLSKEDELPEEDDDAAMSGAPKTESKEKAAPSKKGKAAAKPKASEAKKVVLNEDQDDDDEEMDAAAEEEEAPAKKPKASAKKAASKKATATKSAAAAPTPARATRSRAKAA